MIVCLVTRADLFPPNHGAAVKIVETAKALSFLQEKSVFVATEDRENYFHFAKNSVQNLSYSAKTRAMQEWFGVRQARFLAEKICRRLGYPQEEFFLYSPQFDPAWLLRLVFIGLEQKIDVFQAEFPGYALMARLAAEIVAESDRPPRKTALAPSWHR